MVEKITPARLEVLIRDTARELKSLYGALELRKFTAEKPPEVRTMQNTGGKPSMPGNWLWMSRGITMEQRLREVAFNAFGDLGIKLKDRDGIAGNLLTLVAFHAQAISELDWAGDFHQELDSQARMMGRWLNPPDEVQLKADPYLTAKGVQVSLANKGLPCPESTVRRWAAEGEVKTRKDQSGKIMYCLGDIIVKLKGKK